MQEIKQIGSKDPIESLNEDKMKKMINNPKTKEVQGFRLQKGMKITINQAVYKVIAARPNGKITMKFIKDIKKI